MHAASNNVYRAIQAEQQNILAERMQVSSNNFDRANKPVQQTLLVKKDTRGKQQFLQSYSSRSATHKFLRICSSRAATNIGYAASNNVYRATQAEQQKYWLKDDRTTQAERQHLLMERMIVISKNFNIATEHVQQNKLTKRMQAESNNVYRATQAEQQHTLAKECTRQATMSTELLKPSSNSLLFS
ncbi:hypothetical protein J6590_046336 [Homalodisca vitripennis]|nr:hypothetical protein J6590_046336 [Homalodisca vitripennis]